jgi:hypothetical protein
MGIFLGGPLRESIPNMCGKKDTVIHYFCCIARGIITIFFTIDATTIGLPVHAELPGQTHSLLPAGAEIKINKRHVNFAPQALADLPDDVVFLELAVQKRGRESGKASRFRYPCCLLQAKSVADPATVILVTNNHAEETLHVVILRPDYWKPLLICIGAKCIGTTLIFQIGMDVGIKVVPRQVIPHLPQDTQGVDQAGPTTDVQEEFHVFLATGL